MTLHDPHDPTPNHNRYFVLRWDFSLINTDGEMSEIRRSMHSHINSQIESFAHRYRPWLGHEIEIAPNDAFHSFQSLLGAVRDSNVRSNLSYIARRPGGAQLIVDALQDDASLTVPVLADHFWREDFLTVREDKEFLASWLYYFGVLTLAGRGAPGKLQLRIPNLVTRKLYVEQLPALLFPDAEGQQESRRAVEDLLREGNPQPLCDFIEQQFFNVFDHPDYLQANELTVKTAFLTLLFNDLLYIMDSETAAGRRYADLTMIVRPDARQYQIFDLLLEFKFVKLREAGLSGEAVRGMSRAELASLPPVAERLAEARTQTADYLRELRQRYQPDLRFRVFAIVALGFDRLVWEEIPV